MATGTFTHNSLRTKNPQNAHKNAQESSKNFRAACMMLLVLGRISQKLLLSMCFLAVLGSQGIVVKCTAPIFYRTVDNNIRHSSKLFSSFVFIAKLNKNKL